MSRIIGMALEDRWWHSRSQPALDAEVSSPIFTTALAESPKDPALASPSEAGPSEVDPSGVIIFFI